MKRQRLFKLALLVAVPLALFAYVAYSDSSLPTAIDLPGVRVSGMDFSPDGHYLLVKDSHSVVSDTLVVCDVFSRRVNNKLENSALPLFLEHGSNVAVFSGPSNTVFNWRTRILSFPSLQPIKQEAIPSGYYINSPFVAVWPNAGTLAKANEKGEIILWDTRTNKKEKVVLPLPAPLKNDLYEVKFLSDNNTLLVIERPKNTSHDYRSLEIWDFKTKKRQFLFDGKNGGLRHIGASSNGILVKDGKSNLEIWNYFTGQRKQTINSESSFAHDAILTPDGAMLAQLNLLLGTGTIRFWEITLWDTSTGQQLREIQCRSRIHAIAFSPDGRTLACGGDGFVQLWRVK